MRNLLSSSMVVGEEHLTTAKSVVIYPNPANSYFVVSDKNITSLNIIDYLGKVLMDVNISSNQQKVSTENLPNGLYIVKTVNAFGKTTTSKLLIQH